MTLIRYSNGGFTHSEVMKLTFSQFFAYQDALDWCLNNESKEGQKKNERRDRKEAAKNVTPEEIAEIKRKLAEHKARLSNKLKNG